MAWRDIPIRLALKQSVSIALLQVTRFRIVERRRYTGPPSVNAVGCPGMMNR